VGQKHRQHLLLYWADGWKLLGLWHSVVHHDASVLMRGPLDESVWEAYPFLSLQRRQVGQLVSRQTVRGGFRNLILRRALPGERPGH
jgi:hypothetical protein